MTTSRHTARLDGPNTTIAFAREDGVPAVIHHGERLEDARAAQCGLAIAVDGPERP